MSPVLSNSAPLHSPGSVSTRRLRSADATVAPALPLTAQPAGLNLGDIYFTLFRHKWKILLSAALGVSGAALMYKLNAPPFQSEAKLFVRYIISEGKALGPSAGDATAKSPDQRGETIMKSEAEILSSLDLAQQVAEAFGPERILARTGAGKDLNSAIAHIKNGLSVYVAPHSSVIHVTFRHPDPEIVQPVLREVIERYRRLHVETHTANGTLGEFLAQETDQLRSRLSQTEEELRKATLKAGIISLEDAKAAYSDQLTGIRRDIFNAQAELAQRTAVLEELNQRFPGASAAEEPAPIATDVLVRYRGLLQQIESLQKTEHDLLLQFTPENPRVTETRGLLTAALAERAELEKQHPPLATLGGARRGTEGAAIDPVVLATQITALQAKIKVLTTQLEEIRRDAAKVEQMEGTIVALRRKKELEDASYRYYSASLEQSRINETLGNGRVSNISQIQAPSPPFSDRSKSNKLVAIILASGLVGGVVWAFFIELYFDRSVKRPIDIERAVRMPLFLSIPALSRKQLAAPPLLLNGSKSHSAGPAANGRNGHASSPIVARDALNPFFETLRDRLVGYFESLDLTHKPKLVAVTGLGRQTGITTIAAGLARSLSETGEGNVLLVDMNVGHGTAQQFMKGKEVCGLDQLLDARANAHVEDNLYVAAESSRSDSLSRNMPQRFSRLVPKLKTSDFDYIIFDMPPVSQISITPRLASFMDMVLMVVESERTDRDLVQRATSMLADSRAQVGVVLNKTRRYVPARLYQDLSIA